MRLLPRVNMKRPLWRGGPQLDEVIEAQFSPAQNAATTAADAAAAQERSAVELLLLLR